MYSSVQQLLPRDVQYDGPSAIYSAKQLEEAVKNSSYPPTITCVVEYKKELIRTGRQTKVKLHISGMDREMDFQCPAYEREEGDWSTVFSHIVTASNRFIFMFWPSNMYDAIMPGWYFRLPITL